MILRVCQLSNDSGSLSLVCMILQVCHTSMYDSAIVSLVRMRQQVCIFYECFSKSVSCLNDSASLSLI